MGLVIRGSALLPRDMLEVRPAHLTEECPLKLLGMHTARQDGVGILSPIPPSTCNTRLHPQLGFRPVFPAGIEPPGLQGFPKTSLPSCGAHRPSTVPADGEPPARKLLAGHRAGTSSKYTCVPQNTPVATPGMLPVGVSSGWSFKGISPYLRFCCGAGTPSAAAAHFSQPGPGALGTGGPRCHRSLMPHRRAEPASPPGHWW